MNNNKINGGLLLSDKTGSTEYINVYQANGFKNRNEHLSNLSDIYDIPLCELCCISELFGENEDFDGLVAAVQDFSLMAS